LVKDLTVLEEHPINLIYGVAEAVVLVALEDVMVQVIMAVMVALMVVVVVLEHILTMLEQVEMALSVLFGLELLVNFHQLVLEHLNFGVKNESVY
jgi:hypothetical protein